MIFPPTAFDTVLSNRLAAAAAATMLYVGAVADESDQPDPENVWARPSTVMWMNEAALARTDDESRLAWASAAARNERQLRELLAGWGLDDRGWYAGNTRETLRDETWPKWRQYGAAIRRAGLATSSSAPRWALAASFAGLFRPDLDDQALSAAIDHWRDTHLTPGDRLRIQHAIAMASQQHQVQVQLPGAGFRTLEPGVASQIIKGVVEEWAPRRLTTPMVVAISEPGAKLWVMDAATLTMAGISINVSTLLPDAILCDVGTSPPTFWIVEAVATDGEINDTRKTQLQAWAADQYIDPSHCRFLSAFSSRNSAPARRRLKDIAVGTYCWFLDEPSRELAWNEIPPSSSGQPTTT